MNFYGLSDKAIEEELGRRFRRLRLRNNVTQQQLADATELSLNTIKALESGRCKLSTMIAVSRELGELDQLAQILNQPQISPLQLAKRQGHVRERASGYSSEESDVKSEDSGTAEW